MDYCTQLSQSTTYHKLVAILTSPLIQATILNDSRGLVAPKDGGRHNGWNEMK